MSSTYNPGRVAGFWYLLLVVIGPLRLIYIPSKLFVHGDATATVNNIAAHEWLFRFGMVGDLVGATILIFPRVGLLPVVQESGPVPRCAGGNPRRCDASPHLLR